MAAPLVPYRISVCGVAELDGFATRGVSHVLSILDPLTPAPFAFDHFTAHRRVDLRFHDVVGDEHPDQAPPDQSDASRVIDFGRSLGAGAAEHVLVHCWAGLSRSTASAAILLALDNPGREAEAFAALHDIRPRAWPNSRLIAHADRLLDRRGRLIEAMREHHRQVAIRLPDLVRIIRDVGRGHEVPG